MFWLSPIQAAATNGIASLPRPAELARLTMDGVMSYLSGFLTASLRS